MMCYLAIFNDDDWIYLEAINLIIVTTGADNKIPHVQSVQPREIH